MDARSARHKPHHRHHPSPLALGDAAAVAVGDVARRAAAAAPRPDLRGRRPRARARRAAAAFGGKGAQPDRWHRHLGTSAGRGDGRGDRHARGLGGIARAVAGAVGGAGARRRAGGCARAARRCTRARATEWPPLGERRLAFHGAVVRPAPTPSRRRRRRGRRRRPPSRSAASRSPPRAATSQAAAPRPLVGQADASMRRKLRKVEYELWRRLSGGSWRSARCTSRGARAYR